MRGRSTGLLSRFREACACGWEGWGSPGRYVGIAFEQVPVPVTAPHFRERAMEAPRCRSCGEKHWSRLCVTPAVTVTKPVTPKMRTIVVPCAQCPLYEA